MKRHSQTVSVLDVAAYILANHSNNTPISAWKMHKLLYFCQAWNLVREEQPFFYEKILATSKGVMISELCPQHHGQFYIGDSSKGNLNHLSLRQVDTIDYVMGIYGDKTTEELDKIIFSQLPWQEARKRAIKDSQSYEIALSSLSAYFTKQQQQQ